MTETNYIEINRIGWDRRVKTHVESTFYDVEGFLGGKTSLREIELDELVDVAGRSMLHLQCHFGLDTLSWTRMGASCTGVDISPAAIAQAKSLAQKTGLDARFVCSDIYGFQRQTDDPYDIVFTSYGAICWLPDLDRWADVVSSNLKVGGQFYMVEFHPLNDLLAGYAYFTKEIPDVVEEGSYTENGDQAVTEFAIWAHPFSNVINALVRHGIHIERLNEFPYSPYDCFAGLEEREPGRFYLDHKGHDVPIVYSLMGRKVA